MLCQDDEQIGQGQVSRWSGYTKATSTVIPNCKEQLPTLVFVGYATVGGTADICLVYFLRDSMLCHFILLRDAENLVLLSRARVWSARQSISFSSASIRWPLQ